MERDLKITLTEDGSYTIYVSDINEHYHSTHGAVQESEHIFIEAGFNHWCKTNSDCSEAVVFEVGFGTGLNAFLASKRATERARSTVYHSIELYPLGRDITDRLGFAYSEEEMSMWNLIHAVEWDAGPVMITPYFALAKYCGNLISMQLPDGIDVVFFDAFSPEKEPLLWTELLFSELYQKMNDGGVLTTYCSKGEIRRRLCRCGFNVERIPGPPGKRQIIRATKSLGI